MRQSYRLSHPAALIGRMVGSRRIFTRCSGWTYGFSSGHRFRARPRAASVVASVVWSGNWFGWIRTAGVFRPAVGGLPSCSWGPDADTHCILCSCNFPWIWIFTFPFLVVVVRLEHLFLVAFSFIFRFSWDCLSSSRKKSAEFLVKPI